MIPDGLPLALYDAAWRLAAGPLRLAARAHRRLRCMGGGGFLPAHWLAEERLGLAEGGARMRAGRGDPGPHGGEGVAGRDQGDVPPGSGLPVLWLHAASLGEAKGLRALARILLEGGFPCRLLLTSNTSAGLAWLRESIADCGADAEARIAPLDHPCIVRAFLDRHRVSLLALYELELWPNFIREAASRRVPVLVVSGRMTRGALARYRLLEGTWRRLLDRVDWIQAQGEDDAVRWRALTRRPVASGFDFKAAHYLREPRPGRSGAGQGRRLAFLSLHHAELAWFLPEWRSLMERFPIAVFPRHLREMAAFRRDLLPLGFTLHSEEPSARHVLVDGFGQVGRILPECGMAFVGGSLVPRGCHNLWEPLLAGLRIAFGPSRHNQEALADLLLRSGVAEVVRDPAQTRAWRAADPGTAEACRRIVDGQMRFLEEAEAAFKARIEAALPAFYLFSGK
jgi:3-deoxy-D-manno-octulosonic-acid transferase